MFAQSRSPLEKSAMVIDGNVFEADAQNDDLQKAFDFLVGFYSRISISPLFLINRCLMAVSKWCKSNEVSSQLGIRKFDEGIFIKSTYTDTDEYGRKMQFMFYANTKDDVEACELLKESSMMIGRHLNETELDVIRNGKKKASIVLIIVSIVICVIVLLIVQHFK